MSARLDHELSSEWEERMDRHFAGCRRCAALFASLTTTVARLHELGTEPPPTRPSVLDAVSAKVAAQANLTAGHDTDEPA